MSLNHKIEQIIYLFPVLFGIIFALLNIFYYAGEPRLGADIVSRVLPAVGHRIEIGVPYLNYWEITPPGHYIVLDAWAQIFGFRALSVKILHLTVSLGVILITYLTLKKFLSGVYFLITTTFIYFFIFSTRLTTFILPAELLGQLFSILGLYFLLDIKNYKKAVFLSALFFFFSGQIKDPFLFSCLALAPYILFLLLKGKKVFLNGVVYSFLGVLSAALINIFYLILMGSLKSYLEVLSYKSTAFSVFDLGWLFENFLIHLDFAKDVFFYFRYALSVPILIYVTIKIYTKIKDKDLFFKLLKKRNKSTISASFNWQLENDLLWTVSFYILGLFVGFVIQRSLGSHYYIVAVFPMMLMIGTSFMYADKSVSKLKRNKLLRFIIFFLFITTVTPKRAYLTDYKFNNIPDLRFLPKLALWADKNVSTPVLLRINQKTNKNDCIVDIYGWGVATTYLYSERKPCSRFYIVNIINQEWQRIEYRQSLIDNNPKAVVYDPRSGDIDDRRFEETVVNYTKIINKCYTKDAEIKTLYWPAYDGNELKKCISDNIL